MRSVAYGSNDLLKSCSCCTRGVTISSPPAAFPLSALQSASVFPLSARQSVASARCSVCGCRPLQGCGVHPGGGTTLQMPYGSICGKMRLKYSPGSANSSAVGRNTGHSGILLPGIAAAQCLHWWLYRSSVRSHRSSSSLQPASVSSCCR